MRSDPHLRPSGGEIGAPDARIPIEQELALRTETVRLSGDEGFGVHTAEMLRPGAFDVGGQVVGARRDRPEPPVRGRTLGFAPFPARLPSS